MAKAIKFPLKMPDGTEARTVEDLREHFDLSTVLSYYSNGKLVKWLENGYYDDETKKISELTSSSEELGKQICDILGVSYSEENSVDVGAIFKKTDRLAQLKKFTSDDGIIAAVDRVAFTQDELDDLIKNGVSEVYLCGEHFTVFTNNPNVTYVGVNMPEVEFEGDTFEEGIFIKSVKFEVEKYLNKHYDLWTSNDHKNVRDFFTRFVSGLKSDINQSGIVSKKAQCFIGMCFMDLKDYNNAVEWFRKSADQGDAEAQCKLGECYELGRGVGQDDREAVKWYHMAAEQGCIEGMYRLGELYVPSRGNKEHPNYYEGFKWYRMAAEQGHAGAQRMLGDFYRFWMGGVVEQDYRKAEKWYRMAADQGNKIAQSALNDDNFKKHLRS